MKEDPRGPVCWRAGGHHSAGQEDWSLYEYLPGKHRNDITFDVPVYFMSYGSVKEFAKNFN